MLFRSPLTRRTPATSRAGVLLVSGAPAQAVLADKANDSVTSMQVSDSRVVVASDLTALGPAAAPKVREILGEIRLPPSDAFGRVFAAEAALAVEDHGLAIALITGINERRRSSAFLQMDSDEAPGSMDAKELSILVRAGGKDEVDARVERYFSVWSDDFNRDTALKSVCDAYLRVGRTQDAVDLAERVRANPGRRGNPGWVYGILAQAGRTEVALDALASATVGYGADASMSFGDWDRLARLLWSRNHRDAVRQAARRLVDRCDNPADLLGLANLLRDIGEADSEVVLLAAARAEHTNQIRFRLEPITRLLDTRFRREAREILIELAHSPLESHDVKSVALCLRAAELNDEAKSMLWQRIEARQRRFSPRPDTRFGPRHDDGEHEEAFSGFDEAIAAACELFPEAALEELRALATDPWIMARQALTVADHLISLGDKEAVKALLARFEHETPIPAGDERRGQRQSVPPLPVFSADRLHYAKLHIEAGDPAAAAAVYRSLVRDEESPQLYRVVDAALGLEELGQAEVEDLRAIVHLVSSELTDEADLSSPGAELDLLKLSALLFRYGGREYGITFVRRIVELLCEEAQEVTLDVLRQMEEVMSAGDTALQGREEE